MISFSLFVSKKSRRVLLAGIIVVALAVRGLMPVGYMPDAAHHGTQPFAMTICGGMPLKKSPDDQKLQDHAPCPFSVNAVFAFGGIEQGLQIPFPLYSVLVALTAFAFISTRRFGNAAPRAPPLIF